MKSHKMQIYLLFLTFLVLQNFLYVAKTFKNFIHIQQKEKFNKITNTHIEERIENISIAYLIFIFLTIYRKKEK